MSLRIPAIGALLVALGCASGFGESSPVATRNTIAAPAPLVGEMVALSTARHAFYMDRFETAQLLPGDYFPVAGHVPATQLTASEAGAVCARWGKRLCRVEEWRQACLGLQRQRFSYANEYAAGNCNVSGKAIVPAGLFANCRSDGGIHDLIGNALEWVQSENGRSIAVGGSFADGSGADCFSTHYFPVSARSSQVGLRCCADADVVGRAVQ